MRRAYLVRRSELRGRFRTLHRGALAAAVLWFGAGVGTEDEAAAQERPDFSGDWVEAPEEAGGRGGRGRAPATLGSGWGPEFTIVQSADTLMVERSFFSRGDLQRPLRFRFALDGSETRNSVLMGRGEQSFTSTVAWQGERLVVTSVHRVSNSEGGAPIRSEVVRTIWLEPGADAAAPPMLVIETVRGGVLGGPSSTTRTEYTRGG